MSEHHPKNKEKKRTLDPLLQKRLEWFVCSGDRCITLGGGTTLFLPFFGDQVDLKRCRSAMLSRGGGFVMTELDQAELWSLEFSFWIGWVTSEILVQDLETEVRWQPMYSSCMCVLSAGPDTGPAVVPPSPG